jgi:transposase
MDEQKQQRRPKRQFSEEFKAGAVRLVLDEGKSVSQVARDLDLHPNSLHEWVKREKANRSGGKTGLTTEEREELSRLRRENRTLKMEHEILKKAAAFFAKNQT